MTTYKIEGCDESGENWSDQYIGDASANRFSTEAAAQAELPTLAKVFSCPLGDLRVVEVERVIIWVVSGEGTGQGHRERYDGALTVRALKARLTRERCGGDRWARCEVEPADRLSESTSPEEAIAAATR